MKIQGILKGQEVFQNSIVQEKAAKLIFFSPLHSAEHSLPSFDIDSRQVYLIDTLAHRTSTFI